MDRVAPEAGPGAGEGAAAPGAPETARQGLGGEK
jgi:hypothetical protein